VLAPAPAKELQVRGASTPEDEGQDRARRNLRRRVVRSLKQQGFSFVQGEIHPPSLSGKDDLRMLHAAAVKTRRKKAAKGLRPYESRLIARIAAGREVDPETISPRLVEVTPRSEEELLFRYARLHWSIPISAGYGRRVRFIVIDESNDKLMGIIGLGDPVFSLGPRDRWIGWSSAERRQGLQHVMDAFVLGAVPPYNQLLCSKLMAMLAISNEARAAVRQRYQSRTTLIGGRPQTGQLALLSTMSALGRSSVYNRLRFPNGEGFVSVGFTRGSGDFHFSNGVYDAMIDYASTNLTPTAKHESWGGGFRNKREVIRKTLSSIRVSLERAGARLMLIQPSGRRSFLSSGVATPLDVPPICRDRACAFRITLLASLVPHSPMPLGPVTWGLSTTGATTSLLTVFTERSTFRISSTARLPRLRLKGNPKYWLPVTFDVPPAAVPRWAFGELRPLFVAELDVDPDARHALFTNDLALLRASVSAAGSPPRTGGPFLSWDVGELPETADPVVVPDSCRPGRSCRIDFVLHVRMSHNTRGRLDLAPRLTITLGYPLRAPDLYRAGIEIRPGGEWIRGIGPTSGR
jgi:Druantia protein DruA